VRGVAGRAAGARRGGDVPPGLGREVAAFYGGLRVVVLALLSPLAYWSARYIWGQVGAGCPAGEPGSGVPRARGRPGWCCVAVFRFGCRARTRRGVVPAGGARQGGGGGRAGGGGPPPTRGRGSPPSRSTRACAA